MASAMISSVWIPYFPTLVLLLSLLVVILGSNLFDPVVVKIPCQPQEPYIPNRLRSHEPSVAFESTLLFDSNLDIYHLDTASDRAWDEMLDASGGGFLSVRHNETFTPGWGVSMLHGLHCLQILRASLLTAKDGLRQALYSSSRHADHLDLDFGHASHCLGYIAQYLMCAGDDTIEPPILERNDNGDVRLAHVDGMGYQHRCKNTDFIRETVQKSNLDPVREWDWQPGDTVTSVFASSK